MKEIFVACKESWKFSRHEDCIGRVERKDNPDFGKRCGCECHDEPLTKP